MAALRRIWDSFRGVDRRRMQFEIDMHRLFLLTSHHNRGPESADEVCELGEKLSHEEQVKAVHENVHQQITQIAQSLDDMLLIKPSNKIPAPQPIKSRPSGLSFAVGHQAPKLEDKEALVPMETRPLSMVQVSAALRKSMGYTLDLKPSEVQEAGRGVYLDGEVGLGTVVSFYPGIIYSPLQYRYMRGYPRMDTVNSYLVSRYDGMVIDGQPWGRGGESRELWDGSTQIPTDGDVPSVKLNGPSLEARSNKLWGTLFGAKEAHCARQGSILERRNPLALAHFINHPPKGKRPNVMLCPYNFVCSDPNLRQYIPNVHFDTDEQWETKRRSLMWVHDKRGERNNSGDVGVVRTLVLVSTTEASNEELFLNYRLSNQKQWPVWYHPVDPEEDKRRWH